MSFSESQVEQIIEQLKVSASAMAGFVASEEMQKLTTATAETTALFYDTLRKHGIPTDAAARMAAGYAANAVPKTS